MVFLGCQGLLYSSMVDLNLLWIIPMSLLLGFCVSTIFGGESLALILAFQFELVVSGDLCIECSEAKCLFCDTTRKPPIEIVRFSCFRIGERGVFSCSQPES